MNFDEYLAAQRLDKRLNEALKLKVGDFGTYRDKIGDTIGFLVMGALSHGYIAVTGGWLGSVTPMTVKKPDGINKFRKDTLFEASVYIDESGKVEGKYPVSLYNGDFNSFLSMLDGEDEEDEDEDDEDY